MNPEEEQTALFYDRWTELFQHGFGPVLQAGMLRTGDPPHEDPEESVIALASRAGITDGNRILDAGCGIAGPATIIASAYPNVRIDGVTNSSVQAVLARAELTQAGLLDRVAIHVADYQALPFPSGVFDLALFFESTGYATDIDRMYREAARILKPGGRLYVKDVFRRSSVLDDEARAQMESFDRLWGCVRTRTMQESIAAVISAGLEVSRAAEMRDVGTALLAGSMFTFQSSGRLTPTKLGESFAPRDLDPPIEFGEILAIKPAAIGDSLDARSHVS